MLPRDWQFRCFNKYECNCHVKAKRYAVDAAVECNSSLPEPGNFRRWMAAILTGYGVFHRRYLCGSCVTGMATSRGYLALLRFWR